MTRRPSGVAPDDAGSRVDDEIQDIDDKVNDEECAGEGQDDGLDHREIPTLHRLDQQRTKAVQTERVFDQDSTADQIPDDDTADGNYRNKGCPQSVLEH